MANDNDLSFFNTVHSSYDPYILWLAAESLSDIKTIYCLCKVLAVPRVFAGNQCPLCSLTFDNAAVHLCSECRFYDTLRQTFMEDIQSELDLSIFNFIENLDHSSFTHSLLGASTGIPFTSVADQRQFFIKSIQYVVRVKRCLL